MNQKPKNKCDFCQYFLGNECAAAKSNGQVSSYYCRQAQYEYNQWLQQQKKNIANKRTPWRY